MIFNFSKKNCYYIKNFFNYVLYTDTYILKYLIKYNIQFNVFLIFINLNKFYFVLFYKKKKYLTN